MRTDKVATTQYEAAIGNILVYNEAIVADLSLLIVGRNGLIGYDVLGGCLQSAFNNIDQRVVDDSGEALIPVVSVCFLMLFSIKHDLGEVIAWKVFPNTLEAEVVPLPKKLDDLGFELIRLAVLGKNLDDGTSFRTCWGCVEKLLVAGEKEIIHTKPFFFPIVSAAICTYHLLEVDQSMVSTPAWVVSTLPLQNIACLGFVHYIMA
ncbi:hypothetical protein Taro_021657 [Colocasia esculenta]|uniref:Uncharacterized protein n=1 Tax=Colocasia esculenta TaxID=4460 RepID=A0A843VC61_COLES|nr:hypothetical protein [Colocasia esculenta]